MKQIHNNHYQAKSASALLLVIVGLVMIGGGLSAFFALSLVEDNDLNTLQLSKELDSIAMTGIELAAQALNQSSGGLDFLSDKDSFIFVDEDVDGDSTADSNGFGTYTAQFDETDLPLNQISEYDLIITVTRNSEISNTQGSVRTVGDPRKVIITAEVRDANDNRKRLKAVYYKPWFNGNADDITKPQAENWFFIRAGIGATTNRPVASYDSSSRGGIGEAAIITSATLTNYASKTTTTDADEAENLQPLRLEKTAWLTEFQNDTGQTGSAAEAGVFYRTTYDDAIHSSTAYYFDAEITMPSKFARALDEVDLVDDTYENAGFKNTNDLGVFRIDAADAATDYYSQDWDVNYVPHRGFFNNYINTHTTDETMVAALPTLTSAGNTVAGGAYKVTSHYARDVTITGDTIIYLTGATNSSFRFNHGGRTMTVAAGVKVTIVLLESLDAFYSKMTNFLTDSDSAENLLIIAEGTSTTAASIHLGEDPGVWDNIYDRSYQTSISRFLGVIYAPNSDVYVEEFAGLSIAKNFLAAGTYLHDRSITATNVNAAHNANLGYNAIQVDHSDTSIYPSDTTKYYLLSIEDDSGSSES